MEDTYRELAEALALGGLDGMEEGDHVGPPPAETRQRVLDLSHAPALPIDVSAYVWDEVVPGVRLAVTMEDTARRVRGCLVWASPGARHPLHRHLGDESILVLQGTLRDYRGDYGPGMICHSRAGSSHSEEVASLEECFCYVVYYGELEMVPEPA